MPSVPSTMTVIAAGSSAVEQAGDAEHRRQAERARHDRGVALGAAELGREAADAARVHQRGIGRRHLLGEDDRAAAQATLNRRR